KIYLDAYKRVNTSGGARYPDVNAAILNALNRGTLIINYVGHGGVNNWAHERIFNFNEIRQLKNINTLPLFVTATCEFSRFDRSGGQTAGENLIVNPNGGGIASVTTVRIVYSYQNKQLNEALVKNLFKTYRGRMPTMGELLMEAKNSIWSGNDPNNRKFLLLGDPALTLNYPALEVVTTEINGAPASQFNDTLKALQQVTLSGEVRYPNGTLATDFNGQLQATIFDKATTLTTLANSPGSFKAPFTVFNNIIFNGVASVVQGKFTISFIVPKDIDYRTGRARISYYAEDKQRNVDAHGLDTSMFIGGSLDTIDLDNQGPAIQLFMNNENFRDGGITDANPALLALLQDDQGINLSSALGHQITAILDANTSSPIVLNEYYRSELNDYRKGRVFYPFYNLADGPHTLTVKAWDSHNNSSEATISFIVTSTPALALQNVFCYPNPSSSSVTFSFEHNAAQRPLDADVKIYTLQGNLVRNIKLQLTPDGYRQKNIYWEGDTDDGGQVQKGIYIYRITLTDNLGNNVSKSDKVVIVR
ncbi:MAG: type IX secretion system sortase PorU, partial [Chitinophagales bacterium]|nr:type IX secretion system sortase PorU [Chitinophagales bacterium]